MSRLLSIRQPPTGSGDAAHVEASGAVMLALSSGSAALRARAQRLADNPDVDETAEAIIASFFEDADILDRLASELSA